MNAVAGIIILIGRILFVIFPLWVSGYSGHLKNPKMLEGYAQAMGFPAVSLAGIPAGLWLVVASLSIALGIFPDIGSLMLAAFMVPTAWYFHRYWALEDPNQKMAQTQLFYRNLMVFAACLMLFGFFAAVDHSLRFAITGSAIKLH
jgi:putative oxidoreductase